MQAVTSFLVDNRSSILAGDFLIGLGSALLLVWLSALRATSGQTIATACCRGRPSPGGASSGFFASGGVFAFIAFLPSIAWVAAVSVVFLRSGGAAPVAT